MKKFLMLLLLVLVVGCDSSTVEPEVEEEVVEEVVEEQTSVYEYYPEEHSAEVQQYFADVADGGWIAIIESDEDIDELNAFIKKNYDKFTFDAYWEADDTRLGAQFENYVKYLEVINSTGEGLHMYALINHDIGDEIFNIFDMETNQSHLIVFNKKLQVSLGVGGIE